MILLMGLPGSGKGTQGKMLADHHGLHLISMGELVRLYVTGERRQRMLAGELLDDNEIIDILDKVLKSLPDDEDCVLDGFPRTIPQAEWLLRQAGAGRFTLDKIFQLVASREAVKSRLKARGRMDDKDEVVEARFREYEKLTQPLIDWFKEHDVEIINIDAEHEPEIVNQDILNHLTS